MDAISNVIFMGKYLKLKKTNSLQIWSYRIILVLITVSSLLEINTFAQPVKGLRVLFLAHPLSPIPPINILFCASSFWPWYYSLLCDLELACLSPDWAEAAEQLWKQRRSWGKRWLVGEAGEIWDPPGPVPMSAHKPEEYGRHMVRLSHTRPVSRLGLPTMGATLAFWHPLSRNRIFFSLIPSMSSWMVA